MPKGDMLNEQKPMIDETESTREDAKQSAEAKTGNRTGLVTAMLRHYAIFLELKLGAVCTERSR
jgi:hypothetical protein